MSYFPAALSIVAPTGTKMMLISLGASASLIDSRTFEHAISGRLTSRFMIVTPGFDLLGSVFMAPGSTSPAIIGA
jgi:hypothetical protein